MKNIWIILLLGLTSCQTSKAPSDFRDEYPKWSVGCQDIQKDNFGKIIAKPACWVMVTDFMKRQYNSNDELWQINSSDMIAWTVFRVDSSGAKVPPGYRPGSPCKPIRPLRVGVDGKDISRLSASAQIDAITRADRLFMEKGQPWPYCNPRSYTARMTGAKEAYEDMMAKWKSMNVR